MIKLRDYQHDLYAAISDAWSRVAAVLAVLTTGGGKTVIFSSVIHDHVGAAAAVVHRKEIVGQIACSLAALGVKHRVVAPDKTITMIRRKQLAKFGKSFIDPHALVGVVSVQTLTSAGSAKNAALQAWIKQITLAVYDEGHHYVQSGFWAKAVECFPNARRLFVTATPLRADGKGLGAHADGFADEMVEGPSAATLTRRGFLSPFKYFAPPSDLNMSDIPLTASGDLNVKELRKRVVDSHLVGDVVRQYLDRAAGKKAICFATDVASAHDIAAAFVAAGVTAAALDGSTDDGARDYALAQFEGDGVDVLVNVDLFDEGFDVPAAEVCIMARPTESLAKFLQMIGRVLRPVYAPGAPLSTDAERVAAIAAGPKPFAMVIDPVRNWERHGMPDWPRVWSLDGAAKRSRAADDLLSQRVCKSCTQIYEAFYLACPWCGAVPVPPERSTPEHVDGDLHELDVAAMAALFEKARKADMDDAEYAIDQIARGIPRVGRGADMRRHQNARYRRGVLKELVGWWCGVQPEDRPLREKHKRFYLRFGVDIVSAFTLNERDTDALIERVAQRFNEDMI